MLTAELAALSVKSSSRPEALNDSSNVSGGKRSHASNTSARGMVRSASAGTRRPGAAPLMTPRATARLAQAAQPVCGSLRRAASLTPRSTIVWDVRHVGCNNKEGRKSTTGPDAQRSFRAGPSKSASAEVRPAITRGRVQGTAGNSTLETPRGKTAPTRDSAPKSAFGRAVAGHQPRSPRESMATAYSSATGTAAPATTAVEMAPEKEPEVIARERDRARVARINLAAERRSNDDVDARQEVLRRRATAGRERARADREAARVSARFVRPGSPLNPEVLESAWISS